MIPTYLVRKTEDSYGHALGQGNRVELILFSCRVADDCLFRAPGCG